MKKIKQRIAWFCLILGIIYYCLDFYFRISPSLYLYCIMKQYHIGPLGIGSFASAFYLGYVSCQLPAGWLFDHFPVRGVFAISMLICTLAFAFFTFASSFWLGLILRFITGASSAFAFIAVLYISRTYLPLKYFSLISGITISAGTLAASLGQVLSAYAAHFVSWQTVFLGVSLQTLLIVMILVLPGLSLPHIHGKNSFSKNSFLMQKKVLFYQKQLWVNGIIGGLFYLPTSILGAVWGITFIQSQYHLNQAQAALGITFLFLGWAIGSPFVGILNSKNNTKSMCSTTYTRRLSFCNFVARWSRCSHTRLYAPPHDCTRASLQNEMLGSMHFERTWVYAPFFLTISSFLAFLLSLVFLFSKYHSSLFVNVVLFMIGLCSSAQVLCWHIFHEHCDERFSGLGIALTNSLIMLIVVLGHYLVGFLLSLNSLESGRIIHFWQGLWVIPFSFFWVALLSLDESRFYLKFKFADKN